MLDGWNTYLHEIAVPNRFIRIGYRERDRQTERESDKEKERER